MCNIYFFRGEHIQLGSTCLRSGEKMHEWLVACTSERQRERVSVCVVLCKYLPRAQEGKEKKARTKTNQHYPASGERAVFLTRREIRIHTPKKKNVEI